MESILLNILMYNQKCTAVRLSTIIRAKWTLDTSTAAPCNIIHDTVIILITCATHSSSSYTNIVHEKVVN